MDILEIFTKIAAIPHGSCNEKALGDFVADYARERGYQAVRDDAWDVIVKVPATPGYEESPTVILQGHLDMVCVKEEGCDHDFLTQPLTLLNDGEYLRARGTTLGADDGVSIAYGLALLDDDAPHPPLELCYTVEEEHSMKGVLTVPAKELTGRRLINLDSEWDGVIIAGAAGGCTADVTIPLSRVPQEGGTFRLTVSGLRGGHSGAEIHKERANALRLLGRVLEELTEKAGAGIIAVSGGDRTNAIPVSAWARITVSDPDKAQSIAAAAEEDFRKEYPSSDPDIQVTLAPDGQTAAEGYDRETARRLLGALRLLPGGPVRRDPEMGVVLCSSNLGVMTEEGDHILLRNGLRSSVPSLLRDILRDMRLVSELLGIGCKESTPYPTWEYAQDSPLREAAVRAFTETFGRAPEVQVIHAGLEIGYLAEKLPGLDSISFGPQVDGAHTVGERLGLKSFRENYRFLKALLKALK